MIRNLLVACFAIACGSAFAQGAPTPAGPCAHGNNRMVFGGVDPVEQSCALAIAGQTIAEQAQQIVALRARIEVMRGDAAAEAQRVAADKAKKKADPAPAAK